MKTLEERREKFLREHPEYKFRSPVEMARVSRRERKAERRRKREEEILELRHKDKLTLQAIGDRYGITRERVRQIINCSLAH